MAALNPSVPTSEPTRYTSKIRLQLKFLEPHGECDMYVMALFVQAEEIFDAASRYLLFSLKRAVTDALLPQLETAAPADLCGWLLLADK